MAKSFVLNDESKSNSYGFRILNAGIDLERFKQNPVMLSDHWNHTTNVIGRWDNLRIEGTKLLCDPVFDTEDEDAVKISKKVDGGFLKGVSMGIRFSHQFMSERPDATYVLEKCELFEASIVAVPSNANSVRLYAENGELLEEESLKLSLENLFHFKSEDQNNMSKLNLTATTVAVLMAYGLRNADSPEEVDGAVAKLSSTLEAEKTAHGLEKQARENAEKKLKEQESAALTAMVDQAITDGQILGAQKETFVSLGYDQAKTIIDGLPKKVSLGAATSPQSANGAGEPKNLDEFEKLSLSDQLAFKNGNPTGYAKLFA